jgi:hypothetical protein
MTRLHNSLFTIKKIEPEIPVSYPKRRPLDAATMHVMMIESVNLPPMLMVVSITTPPRAIFQIPCFYIIDLSISIGSCMHIAAKLYYICLSQKLGNYFIEKA